MVQTIAVAGIYRENIIPEFLGGAGCRFLGIGPPK